MELRVIPTFQTVAEIAQRVSEDVCARTDISPLTKSRFAPNHLEAVGMEYEAALKTGDTPKEGMSEAGRLHRTVNQAMRERVDGRGTSDVWARHFMLKRICETKRNGE